MPTYKNITLVNAKVDGNTHTGTLQIEVIDRKFNYLIEVFITCDFEPDNEFWSSEVNRKTTDYKILADLIPDAEEISFIRDSICNRASEWVQEQGKAEFDSFFAIEVLPEPDSNAQRRKLSL